MKSKIKSIPFQVRDSEIEDDEVVLTPNLITHRAIGFKHSKGGINTFLPSGSLIFSSKLKADKETSKEILGKEKSISFADLVMKYDTERELSVLNNSTNQVDNLDRETAELMLSKKLEKIHNVFDKQEFQKKETSKRTLEDIMLSLYKKGGKHGYIPSTVRGYKDKVMQYQNGDTHIGTTPINRKQLTLAPGSSYFSNMAGLYKNNPNLFSKTDKGLFKYNPLLSHQEYGNVLNSNRKLNSNDILDYQKKMTGLNNDGTYATDDQSKLNRLATFSHLQQNYASNWNHTSKPIYGIKSDGSSELIKDLKSTDFNNYVDFDFRKTNLLDSDNLPDDIKTTTDNAAFEFMVGTEDVTPTNPLNFTPRPTSEDPNNHTTTDEKITPSQGIVTPYDAIKNKIENSKFDDIKNAYKLSQTRDIVDLATLDIQPPNYRYKPQNIAYKRFLPIDTLSAERQYNVQKESINNSSLPTQVKQAYLNDLSAKYQDSISETQLRNYQGDMQNDNENINTYNQVTNANRQERLNYDENYDQKIGLTNYNASQERLRIGDRLMNNYGKNEDMKFKMNLINQLGDGYYFDGTDVKMKPGYIPSKSDPMSQYSDNQREAILKKIKEAKTEAEGKLILKLYGLD